MKERLTYIDCLKGFLILLVVLGHVVQKMYRPETFDDNLLFRMIYSFHMPAFFLVSGFVTKFCKIDFDILSKKTIKRFKQLIIPFITWGIIWHFTFHETTLFGFFKAPDNSLWFLWDLFWIVLVYNTALFLWSLFPRISGIFYIIGGFFALKVLALLFGSNFGIRGISDYFLYYIIGILLGSYKDRIFIHNTYSPYITSLMLLAFVFLSSLWYRYSCVPEGASPLIHSLNGLFLYRLITPLLGSVSLIYFFYLLTPEKPRKLGKVFLYFGVNTLAIYAVHQTVIWSVIQLCPQLIVFMTTIGGLIISFVVVLFSSIAFMFLLKSNRATSLLFLGSE